jgi:hypothetical protein
MVDLAEKRGSAVQIVLSVEQFAQAKTDVIQRVWPVT